MKVYQHVNIVTCDQDFHVYLDGILAVKDSQIEGFGMIAISMNGSMTISGQQKQDLLPT